VHFLYKKVMLIVGIYKILDFNFAGIAFEQGKVLPTPETVPFRLTRDIEAAMGVSGVEGTMRRCCEQTMTVLREQKEIIVTLLRVLLYDPLYSWAITPAKAATYQSEHSTRSSQCKESNSPGNYIIRHL
jgi:ataxia telangiectasia mutated family protein